MLQKNALSCIKVAPIQHVVPHDRDTGQSYEEHIMALAPTPQPYRFTVEEYLAFERASDERHEYLDGVIYAMAGSASTQAIAGESEDHGTICMNLSVSLGSQLR